jgi:hypothetical protein
VRLKRDDWRMVSNLVRAAMATKNYGKAITAMHQLVTLRVDETRSFGVEAEELQALVHAVVSSVKFQQRTAAAPAAGEADEKAAAASTAASASAVAAVAGSSGDGVAVASGGVPSSSAGPSDGDGSGESKDGAEDWLDSQGVPAANYLDATAKLLGHITSAVSRDARVRCTQTVLFACPLLSRAGSCARRCAGVASLRPGTHGSRQGSGRSRLHDEGGLSLLSFVHCRLHHRCQCASVSCLCLCAVSLPAVRVVGPRARRRVCPCRCVEGPRGVLHARGAIAERRSERVCACTVTGAAACVALSCAGLFPITQRCEDVPHTTGRPNPSQRHQRCADSRRCGGATATAAATPRHRRSDAQDCAKLNSVHLSADATTPSDATVDALSSSVLCVASIHAAATDVLAALAATV